MFKTSEKKKYYSIGEVSKIVGLHDQTIRTYEKKRLIHVSRNTSNYRVFTKKNIEQITLIITLTQEYGINFSGVKIIMELANRLEMDTDELLDFIGDHANEFNV